MEMMLSAVNLKMGQPRTGLSFNFSVVSTEYTKYEIYFGGQLRKDQALHEMTCFRMLTLISQ